MSKSRSAIAANACAQRLPLRRCRGHIVPVRGQYDPASPGTSIGVNPLTRHEPIWLAGPDLIASWLLTGE